jgi:hypothetical protein
LFQSSLVGTLTQEKKAMCLKEVGKREPMNISQARLEHQSLLQKLMQGPSDSEGAMHKAERLFGLGYWAQKNLRHKHRASSEFIWRLHQAYLSVLENSVKRDLAYLENQVAKGAADVGTENLLVEAANLVASAKNKLAEIQELRGA